MRDVRGFFDAVLQCEIGLWDALDRDVQSALDVTLGRLQALRVVGRLGGRARVQEVAEELMITVGAASKLVDRLEGDGTVVRSPNPADRRSSLLALTSSGEGVLSQGEEIVAAALERCLDPAAVADAELASATALLRRLDARLRSPLEKAVVDA